VVVATLCVALLASVARAEKRPRMRKPRRGQQIAVGPVAVSSSVIRARW